MREVVANSVPAILSDQDIVKELISTDRKLGERIRDFFADFWQNLQDELDKLVFDDENMSEYVAPATDRDAVRQAWEMLDEALGGGSKKLSRMRGLSGGNPNAPSKDSSKTSISNSAENVNNKFSLRSDAIQTDTLEFKRWFGNSKVVNEDGTPKVMYHGSDAYGFTVFNTVSGNEFGAHFGTERAAKDILEYYGAPESNAGIYQVYLRMQNPIELPDIFGTYFGLNDYIYTMRGENEKRIWKNDHVYNVQQPASTFPANEELTAYHDYVETLANDDASRSIESLKNAGQLAQEYLKSIGYDGVMYQNDAEDVDSTSYIVFDPTQIKSATDNIGTFDPKNPDIRYSMRTKSDLKASLLQNRDNNDHPDASSLAKDALKAVVIASGPLPIRLIGCACTSAPKLAVSLSKFKYPPALSQVDGVSSQSILFLSPTSHPASSRTARTSGSCGTSPQAKRLRPGCPPRPHTADRSCGPRTRQSAAPRTTPAPRAAFPIAVHCLLPMLALYSPSYPQCRTRPLICSAHSHQGSRPRTSPSGTGLP